MPFAQFAPSRVISLAPRSGRTRIMFLVCALATVCGAVAGCYPKADTTTETKEPPVTVKLAKVEVSNIQNYYITSGRTDVDPINIVPRVRGRLEEINFNPGDIVKEGDVLYKIEDFDYKNRVSTAKANCDIARAQAAKAKADYDRQVGLNEKGKGFTTQEDIDRTKALLAEAIAHVSSTDANLDLANKELERTVITAPCTGKINRTNIEVGNLVDGSIGIPEPLTTIMPMDPMYVYFEITDAEFAEHYKGIINTIHKIGKENDPNYDPTVPLANRKIEALLKEYGIEDVVKFHMGLPSDPAGEYPYEGLINYNENKVDRNTGTVTMRGEIANPDYMIYPGYICRICVPTATIENAVLVEEKAICRDLSDIYVWTLDGSGKPQKTLVTLGGEYGQSKRIILSGLSGGESYIVEGTEKVRTGCDIKEDGLDVQGTQPGQSASAPHGEQAETPAR